MHVPPGPMLSGPRRLTVHDPRHPAAEMAGGGASVDIRAGMRYNIAVRFWTSETGRLERGWEKGIHERRGWEWGEIPHHHHHPFLI